MIYEVIVASGVGGLLWLDRFQAFQVMISRPLVAAPLIGWLVGDVRAGLATGILYELFWLGRPPVGGYIPPDSTLAAVATAAVSGIVAVQWGAAIMPTVVVSFLALFPVAHLGRRLDTRLRVALGKSAALAEAMLKQSPDANLAQPMFRAFAQGFLFGFAALVPAIVIGTYVVGGVMGMLTPKVLRALEFAYYVIPVMAAADVMVHSQEREESILFLIGFVAFLCAGMLLGLFNFGL
ncbi:MAG: PTS sugar transporter subunit IIC [Desulfomonile sp.]|nr:PTS sugar transporter subunit IIC [Desulfomonile sp.]